MQLFIRIYLKRSIYEAYFNDENTFVIYLIKTSVTAIKFENIVVPDVLDLWNSNY